MSGPAAREDPHAAGRRGILCAGGILVDAGKVIDAYPPLDRLAIIESVALSTGGAALNMAVDLRRLRAPFPVALLAWSVTTRTGRMCGPDARAWVSTTPRSGRLWAG